MRIQITLTLLILAIELSFVPPVAARQHRVSPTFRSAGADLKVSATTSGINSAQPFAQDQVSKMVQAGLGDDSGAKLIEQRGIDFAPSEGYLQTLKAAGANEAFLNALRAAKPTRPAVAKKPINQVQVFALLAGQVPSHRISMLIHERGIDFDPTDDYVQEVRLAGGEDELIGALKFAKATMVITVDTAARARQTQVRQHVARGAELEQKEQYSQAEQEYRAALLIDPRNAYVYLSVASALSGQNKWDEAISAYAEALRLDPNNEVALELLGMTHGRKADWLANKGEWNAAITEYNEALRLNLNDKLANEGLFLAHLRKGEWLENQGKWDDAITEYEESVRLDPASEVARGTLESLHGRKAVSLMEKRDWDGAITELREAQQLNPKDAFVHNCTGFARESKGDLRGALEEYRVASMLDPTNTKFKQDYERLVSQVNQ